VDSKPYQAQLGIIRPSHADYVAWVKYGIDAKIGGNVFSGRMTALFMILGALCTNVSISWAFMCMVGLKASSDSR
jgi:chorismate synthase